MFAGQVKIWSRGKGSFKAVLEVDYNCDFLYYRLIAANDQLVIVNRVLFLVFPIDDCDEATEVQMEDRDNGGDKYEENVGAIDADEKTIKV
ncbi:hypothetical protein E3N88_05785 [Mikania micrantha]|uniref:Uncharacterized protein n=1 Tax=Mikania micrantha TaxID=192012 RepID=A0A5N6PPW0_9ASTR|nr:hypothetical protein E3N88_05785 [Mikania micrantha]